MSRPSCRRAHRGALLVAPILLVALAALAALLPVAAAAAPTQRFFVSGSGVLRIRATNGRRFAGRYRDADGRYLPRALRRIDRVFGASGKTPAARVSLRLIEVLAFMREQLGAPWVVISSGYRSPRHNQRLRDKGRTVAQASLHQFGMAADVRFEGVASEAAWRLAQERKLGGAGYYGGPWVHVDSGPTRHWTQQTANVRAGLSEHNQRLILVPELDVYAPGETIELRFARMTAFPIGVLPRLSLERRAADGNWVAVGAAEARFPGIAAAAPGACRRCASIAAMAGIRWRLPGGLPAGRYRLKASFCDVRWPQMPAQLASYELELRP